MNLDTLSHWVYNHISRVGLWSSPYNSANVIWNKDTEDVVALSVVTACDWSVFMEHGIGHKFCFC